MNEVSSHITDNLPADSRSAPCVTTLWACTQCGYSTVELDSGMMCDRRRDRVLTAFVMS